MVGRQFGELTVLREYDRGVAGARWLCRCDCGREAIRKGAYLRYRAKFGGRACCSECLVELRRGISHDKRERFKSFLREYWEEHNSLYTENEEWQMCEDVRAALEAEFGPTTEPTLKPSDLTIDPGWGKWPRSRSSSSLTDEDRPEVLFARAHTTHRQNVAERLIATGQAILDRARRFRRKAEHRNASRNWRRVLGSFQRPWRALRRNSQNVTPATAELF
jgi:hypothetical protein